MSAQNDANGGFLWLIMIYAGLAWYFGWWPLNNTTRAIENGTYGIYYTAPDGKESYLGTSNGLSECGAIAYSKANWSAHKQGTWSYVCCRVTSSSNCEAKYR